jgi:hypothetical protein
MNIQELHNRLIKRASMQKIAGWRSSAFKSSLDSFNKLRANDDIMKGLRKIIRANLKGPNTHPKFSTKLIPYYLENKHLNPGEVLRTLKDSAVFDHNTEFIDKLIKHLDYRVNKIEALAGYEPRRLFEKNIINKYIKDVK